MSETLQLVKWQLQLIDEPRREWKGRCDLLYDRDGQAPRDRVVRLGLDARFEAAFLHTNPVEYGWFASSPLSREQTALLQAYTNDLMDAPPQHDSGLDEIAAVLGIDLTDKVETTATRRDNDLAECSSALDLALKANLKMSVELTPPGHTDLGVHTIHCHCPRCKKRAPFEPWNGDYPTDPYECTACGLTYVPAETRSSRRYFEFQSVICMGCHAVFDTEQFSEEDKIRIDRHVNESRIAAELRTIRAIKAVFYQFAEPQERSDHEKSSTMVRRVLKRALSDSSTAAHRNAVRHLESHLFNLEGREEFAAGRLREGRPYSDDDTVYCPSCAGSMF